MLNISDSHCLLYVCVNGVLRRFQQSFSYITTVAACCMRRDSARGLSAANTDTPFIHV